MNILLRAVLLLTCAFPAMVSAESAQTLVLDLGGQVALELTLIPAGKFLMGDPTKPAGHDEAQFEVTITKPFYMGIHEVTQAQYQAIMGKNPVTGNAENLGASKPVTMQAWPEAVEFCTKASAKTGRTVRLPTEAEWEYAARAGTTTQFFHGDHSECNVDYTWGPGMTGGHFTKPVGQLLPNPWGLYDIQGNVWEMTSSWLAPYPQGPQVDYPGAAEPKLVRGAAIHVTRGGSFYAGNPGILGRYGYPDDSPKRHIGFRVVVETR